MLFVTSPSYGYHHITAAVSSLAGDRRWWLTGIYGPQSDVEKLQFLADLQEERVNCAGPWVLGGNFNMIASADDKNNSRLNLHMMRRFRCFMADMELRDLYLHGRPYTWANKRDNPTLVRIDRVLCTPAWNEANPHYQLHCLSSAASDHCPLMVDCTVS